MDFKILRGHSTNLDSIPSTLKVDGYWYLTVDDHKLYTCIDGDIVPISSAGSFDPVELENKITDLEDRVSTLELTKGSSVQFVDAFPESTEASTSILYVRKSDNASYRYDGGGKWTAVGRDYKEIVCIDGGNASRDAE